jgi:hypothetical protein
VKNENDSSSETDQHALILFRWKVIQILCADFGVVSKVNMITAGSDSIRRLKEQAKRSAISHMGDQLAFTLHTCVWVIHSPESIGAHIGPTSTWSAKELNHRPTQRLTEKQSGNPHVLPFVQECWSVNLIPLIWLTILGVKICKCKWCDRAGGVVKMQGRVWLLVDVSLL